MEKKENIKIIKKDEIPEETKQKETLGVKDDIHVLIESKEDGVLFDENCCTIINIILNNEKEIATSFYGIHNEDIIKQLIKAQKMYFKALKKALKEERKTAKSMLDEEVDKEADNKNDEEFIHHIKEYEPNIENTQENNKPNSKPNTNIVETKTDSFEHTTSPTGKNIIKKKRKSTTKNNTQTQQKKKQITE